MKIAVIGAGITKFGELWDKSLADLLAESQFDALDDAAGSATQWQRRFQLRLLYGVVRPEHALLGVSEREIAFLERDWHFSLRCLIALLTNRVRRPSATSKTRTCGKGWGQSL